MNLQERINDDLKRAMKMRDKERVTALRNLKAALANAAIEEGGELSDEKAISVLRKQAKQREESIRSFRQAGREERAADEEKELAVIKEYLPKPLTAEEVSALVMESIQEAQQEAQGNVHMGDVMRIAQSKAAGRVDGKTLSQEVQKELR